MNSETQPKPADGESRHKVGPVPAEPAGSARLGLVLFSIYLVFYLVFVFVSAFASQWLEVVLPGGLNLAVVYGFGLILLALVLAMIYGAAKS